ncbi:hypothetical protein AVEN_251044-1 [Araneus ventricosus]|uniref:Uncharacterized protein n=1 Tax=Araneus ventricosus TaxID=182803 RepID=A0A4Y2DLR3_ARAVE|nr:hypothetical protein AVEN_251044-1 [Araneus ventricosus]
MCFAPVSQWANAGHGMTEEHELENEFLLSILWLRSLPALSKTSRPMSASGMNCPLRSASLWRFPTVLLRVKHKCEPVSSESPPGRQLASMYWS